MSLSKSQKKYIAKNIRKMTPEEISEHLEVSETAILNYAKNRWESEKYKKIISSRGEDKDKSQITELKLLHRDLISIGLLCLFVILIYANSLNNVFLSDDFGIVQNKELGTLKDIISTPFSFLRPIFYAIALRLGGLHPMPFRLINIILHMGVVSVLFLILSKLKNYSFAFFTSLIVAVHPIFTESVTWISGGGYVQYSFFILLSIYFYQISGNKVKMLLLSYLTYFLALESSITASALVLLYPIYEISFGSIKKNWLKITPFFIICVAFVIPVFTGGLQNRQSQLDASYIKYEKGSANILISVPYAISNYLQLIFWPNSLTLYHASSDINVTYFFADALITIFSFLILLFFFWRNKFNFFWMSIFFMCLLPSLLSHGVAWIVAERYVYLGAVGIIAVVTYYLDKAMNNKQLKALTVAFLIFVVILLSIRTIVRNNDWKNEDNLWIATGKTSPSDPKTHNNLGDVYARRGDLEKSAREFSIAIRLNPNYADAMHNLANIYMRTGKTDQAIGLYNQALTLKPILWQSHQNLASIYYSQKKFDKAEFHTNEAIKINPQSAGLYIFQAYIYIETGQVEQAKSSLKKALELEPNNKLALETLSKL